MRASVVALAALATFVSSAAAAHADTSIAEVQRDTPLAGYAGWTAWSDAVGDRFRLVLRAPDGTVTTPALPTSARPWDVSLGPDARGAVVAIYRRCTAAGCGVRRLSVATGQEQVLRSVDAPAYDEATPAIWRSTVAFTRRIRGCDVPYAKTLGSPRPSRRLLQGKCLQIPAGRLALRGTRVVTSGVDFSGADRNGAGRKVAEVRRYATTGGPSAVLLRQAFGEESNLFGQVAIDERHVTTVRYGVRPTPSFVRVPLVGGTPQEVPAHLTLTGAFAKSSAGTAVYLEAQDDETDTCSAFTPVPCRVVRQPHSPFGRAVRPLPPRLTVGYVSEPPFAPAADQPLPFRGGLTRRVVQDGQVIRTEPLAGVVVSLRRRIAGSPERFEATSYAATTDADGRYEIVVPPPIPRDPWFTAVAATPDVPTWAGRGTVGRTA